MVLSFSLLTYSLRSFSPAVISDHAGPTCLPFPPVELPDLFLLRNHLFLIPSLTPRLYTGPFPLPLCQIVCAVCLSIPLCSFLAWFDLDHVFDLAYFYFYLFIYIQPNPLYSVCHLGFLYLFYVKTETLAPKNRDICTYYIF